MMRKGEMLGMREIILRKQAEGRRPHLTNGKRNESEGIFSVTPLSGEILYSQLFSQCMEIFLVQKVLGQILFKSTIIIWTEQGEEDF